MLMPPRGSGGACAEGLPTSGLKQQAERNADSVKDPTSQCEGSDLEERHSRSVLRVVRYCMDVCGTPVR